MSIAVPRYPQDPWQKPCLFATISLFLSVGKASSTSEFHFKVAPFEIHKLSMQKLHWRGIFHSLNALFILLLYVNFSVLFFSFVWQVMVNSEKDRASLLCMKALANRGRLDTVSQQMASHPKYLESFLRTQHYILYMDGPLPLPYRHYIAIMVRTEWPGNMAKVLFHIMRNCISLQLFC